MNAFDWGLVVLAAALGGIGLVKGLARILIAIASLVVAFLLASHFRDPVAAWLMSVKVIEPAARIVAYLAIFLTTMLAGGAVAWVVGKIVKFALLSWADRLAGVALGLVAALLAAAFVVHPIVASSATGRGFLRTSRLAPYVSVVADLANFAAPVKIAETYRREIEGLRRVWRGEAREPVEPEPAARKP